jgi:Fe-S oxidoreductase
MNKLISTDADILLTSCPYCNMKLRKDPFDRIKVMRIVKLLEAEICGADS